MLGSQTRQEKLKNTLWSSVLVVGVLTLLQCSSGSFYSMQETSEAYTIRTQQYHLKILKYGFRFQFSKPQGQLIAPFHPVSGLLLAKEGIDLTNVAETKLSLKEKESLEFEVVTEAGLRAKVSFQFKPHLLKVAVRPLEDGNYTILTRTGGMAPAYGMADHAAVGEGGSNVILDEFVRDPMVDDHGRQRMLSNFVIYPQQGFATVNVEPNTKIVRITSSENAQGSQGVRELSSLYYFLGQPKEIYSAFLEARNTEGYPVYKPKSAWFGVGWEAFGALAWNTNHQTVKQNVDQYLEYGYPLSWMVVGSGFWPRGVEEFDEHGTPYTTESATEAAKKLQATTSFGMWDEELYPDPASMIDYFHKRGLVFTIGLRIGFIEGGPFTDEGLNADFFIQDVNQKARLFTIGFPRSPIYILDHRNPEAVQWYVKLCQKWINYGVDGFKEDLFHWPNDLPDDLLNPVNQQLMDLGIHIMGRNNYLGSPVDIHRFDDFNYNQIQDRGPINGLAYAYSGFPYVYPDIIGGTGLATGRFGQEPSEKLKTYIVRYAQYASLNPAMAFGFGPWNFDEETNQLCLDAARRHHRLLPHIYSNAVKSFENGFPYSMTPLPLAFPDDPKVYDLANTSRRMYQWLIGESLLAAPLYGDDYASVFARDIYLPEGSWMDYDNGKVYQGPLLLKDFEIPLQKTPLFVGGTGFVIEQENSVLLGRLYPIGASADVVFWHTDGETKSTIDIDVEDWNNLSVSNLTTGKSEPIELVRHAVQFKLEPGQNYRIR